MIPLIRKELRDRRFSLLAYCAIIVLLITTYIVMYPTIEEQARTYNELFNSLPGPYQEIFGMEQNSFTTLDGFLGIELFSLTLPLLVMLLAISRAGGAIAGEVERGTLRTLLSAPISRARIYAAKYAAGVVALAVFTAVFVAVIPALAAASHLTFHAGRVAAAGLLTAVFGLAVYSVSLALSAALSDRGKVYMVMGGFMLAQYVMHVIAGLQDKYEWLDKFSAFHYFDGTAIMNGASVHAASWWVFIVVAAAAAVGGLIIFRRRDIPAQ